MNEETDTGMKEILQFPCKASFRITNNKVEQVRNWNKNVIKAINLFSW